MDLKLHPQVSKVRRQTAVEQTSDLLKAYLEHWSGPVYSGDESEELDERAAALSAGFILPHGKLV
jgi:hypothetical protein